MLSDQKPSKIKLCPILVEGKLFLKIKMKNISSFETPITLFPYLVDHQFFERLIKLQ